MSGMVVFMVEVSDSDSCKNFNSLFILCLHVTPFTPHANTVPGVEVVGILTATCVALCFQLKFPVLGQVFGTALKMPLGMPL